MLQKVYLFDLDGTLTDTAHVWVEIFADCLRELGITPPEPREIAKCTHYFNSVISLGVTEEQLPRFIDSAHKQGAKRLQNAPLHDGALEMLTTLQQHGHKTGVVTSVPHAILEPYLEDLGIKVDVAVGGGEIERYKPHPDGILLALKRLGVEPSRTHVAYYGDKDTDIEAAHNAGVRAVHFFPASHAELYDLSTMTVQPDERISHWNEVLQTLTPA